MSPGHVWVWYSFIDQCVCSVCSVCWIGTGEDAKSAEMFGYLTQVLISGFVLLPRFQAINHGTTGLDGGDIEEVLTHGFESSQWMGSFDCEACVALMAAPRKREHCHLVNLPQLRPEMTNEDTKHFSHRTVISHTNSFSGATLK